MYPRKRQSTSVKGRYDLIVRTDVSYLLPFWKKSLLRTQSLRITFICSIKPSFCEFDDLVIMSFVWTIFASFRIRCSSRCSFKVAIFTGITRAHKFIQFFSVNMPAFIMITASYSGEITHSLAAVSAWKCCPGMGRRAHKKIGGWSARGEQLTQVKNDALRQLREVFRARLHNRCGSDAVQPRTEVKKMVLFSAKHNVCCLLTRTSW